MSICQAYFLIFGDIYAGGNIEAKNIEAKGNIISDGKIIINGILQEKTTKQ